MQTIEVGKEFLSLVIEIYSMGSRWSSLLNMFCMLKVGSSCILHIAGPARSRRWKLITKRACQQLSHRPGRMLKTRRYSLSPGISSHDTCNRLMCYLEVANQLSIERSSKGTFICSASVYCGDLGIERAQPRIQSQRYSSWHVHNDKICSRIGIAYIHLE